MRLAEGGVKSGSRTILLALWVAITILATSPIAARPSDIGAIEKRFDALFTKGDYAGALVEGQKLAAAVKARVGVNHPDYATALNNLANVYRFQGKYAEAEELHLCALAIKEKALGPSHPAVASSLNNLAVVYQDQGNYAEAAELYQSALAIEEKALGPSHPDIAASLDNLANVYMFQGKYAEAADLHLRALAIKETTSRRSSRA
jgi:tetratricopeptide (TPR) repeat protein